MKTSIVLEKSVDKLTALINAVPTASINKSKDFNLVYHSETGEVLRDVKQITSAGPGDYSIIELNVNSDGKVNSIPEKVKSIDLHATHLSFYMAQILIGLEPYEQQELNMTEKVKNEKCSDREFKSRAGDYILLDLIEAYNKL